MKRIKPFMLVFLFNLIVLSGYSQAPPYLDTVYIYPVNPTATDSIYLIGISQLNVCDTFHSHNYSLVLNDIDAYVYYCHPACMLPAFGEVYDSLKLGGLLPGIYNITYKLIHAIDTLCMNFAEADSFSFSFTVSPATAVSSTIADRDGGIKVFPNPSSGSAVIEFNNHDKQSLTLEVYSITNRLVLKEEHITTDRILIEKGELTSGVYYLLLRGHPSGIKQGKLVIR